MNADSMAPKVAAVLRTLPRDDESPVVIDELCRRAGFDPEAADTVGPVLLTFLDLLGVLDGPSPHTAERAVKAKSATASLLATSLAEHISADRALLDNWSRAARTDPPYADQDLLAGPLFLYLIEQRRLREDVNAAPLGSAQVAQVLVGRRDRGDSTKFLLLYDPKASDFQLPGGHRRPDDATMRDVAVRELEEELHDFRFDPAQDRLVELGTVRVTQVSRTRSVVTRYDMTYFHLRSTRTSIHANPQAQWVDAATLVSEDTAVAGRRMNTVGLRMLNPSLPGGVAGLEPSLQPGGSGWIRTTAATRPLEFWGLVTGIVGLISSVVFFLLS